MIITEEMLYKNLECELFNLIGREIPTSISGGMNRPSLFLDILHNIC